MAVAKTMADESIDVAPNADNGNVPAEQVAPVASSEPTPPGDQPASTTDTAPAAAAEPQLYELPDGRKVDAETLTKEWKENFLPDYTRKSQEIARIKTAVDPTAPNINNDQPKNPLEDPNWQPTSIAEVIQVAKEATLKEIEGKEAAKEAARQNVENEIATQLSDVKKLDANVDENALFLHATKYGFRDLRQAHANMRDMQGAIKKVQTATAQNVQKRNDPVSITPGASGAKPNPSQFSSAVEYMRALRGQQ